MHGMTDKTTQRYSCSQQNNPVPIHFCRHEGQDHQQPTTMDYLPLSTPRILALTPLRSTTWFITDHGQRTPATGPWRIAQDPERCPNHTSHVEPLSPLPGRRIKPDQVFSSFAKGTHTLGDVLPRWLHRYFLCGSPMGARERKATWDARSIIPNPQVAVTREA